MHGIQRVIKVTFASRVKCNIDVRIVVLYEIITMPKLNYDKPSRQIVGKLDSYKSKPNEGVPLWASFFACL